MSRRPAPPRVDCGSGGGGSEGWGAPPQGSPLPQLPRSPSGAKAQQQQQQPQQLIGMPKAPLSPCPRPGPNATVSGGGRLEPAPGAHLTKAASSKSTVSIGSSSNGSNKPPPPSGSPLMGAPHGGPAPISRWHTSASVNAPPRHHLVPAPLESIAGTPTSMGTARRAIHSHTLTPLSSASASASASASKQAPLTPLSLSSQSTTNSASSAASNKSPVRAASSMRQLASQARHSKCGTQRLPPLDAQEQAGSDKDKDKDKDKQARHELEQARLQQKSSKLGDGYGMFRDPWQRVKVVGQGQFGVVYMARNLRNNELVAVKQVRITSAKQLDLMIDEVRLNCRASFRNANVVGCLGWSVSDASELEAAIDEKEQFGMALQSLDEMDKEQAVGRIFNIFQEFVTQGAISSLLEKNGGLPEAAARNYTRQLLLGLRSLHAAGIAHRDIKCQNLLLSSDHVVKVADFGSAKKVANQTVGAPGGGSSITGSIPWMSPEVIRQEVGKGGDKAAKLAGWKFADVWSVGCTMIEMLEGKPPWDNYSNPAAMMFAIAGGDGPPRLTDETVVHADGLDFLSLCFRINPADRPSVAKLVYHPYMRAENVDADGNYCPKQRADDDDSEDDDSEDDDHHDKGL